MTLFHLFLTQLTCTRGGSRKEKRRALFVFLFNIRCAEYNFPAGCSLRGRDTTTRSILTNVPVQGKVGLNYNSSTKAPTGGTFTTSHVVRAELHLQPIPVHRDISQHVLISNEPRGPPSLLQQKTLVAPGGTFRRSTTEVWSRPGLNLQRM